MVSCNSGADSASNDDYKAGYCFPQGLWGFGLIAAIGTLMMIFFGIQMLKAYYVISSAGLPEYASMLPGMLSRAVIMLILSLVPVLTFTVYCIRFVRMVREQSLLITQTGIECLSSGSSVREILWQDISALSHLKLSRHTYLIRVVTASGPLPISGSCLHDAEKTVGLIRKHANLPDECGGMLWVRYCRKGTDTIN